MPKPKINGTSHDDILFGSAGADTIRGGAGDDTINGLGGPDTLIGGSGADTFVMQAGGYIDFILDFNPAEGDRILFDYGNGSTPMFSGPLSDGMNWISLSGQNCQAGAGDYDADGVMDTRIHVNDVAITILGYSPEMLTGDMFFGG